MPEQPQTLSTQQALDLALQHHRAGRLPQAESIYKQILPGDPNQPVVLQLLGVSAHQLGNNDVAVDLITKALALEPEYPEAHNNLGLALQGLGKPDDAVNSYRKALAIRPDYADAHNNLGNALQVLGEFEDSVSSYRKAVKYNPDYAMAHNNLGNALQELGKVKEAEASYQRALSIEPDYADAHNNLGNALRRLDKLEEAVASYRRALALNTDHARAHCNLGEALRDQAYKKRQNNESKYFYASGNKSLLDKSEKDELWDDVLACANKVLSNKSNDTAGLALKTAALISLNRLDDWGVLCDFDRLIQIQDMSVPVGYEDLRIFNEALLSRCASDENPTFEAPGKSIKKGKRINLLHKDPSPGPVSSLLEFVNKAATRYRVEHPVDPRHPYLARSPSTWRINAWGSILGKQGFHESHIHRSGWLSGVYYSRLPDVMKTDNEKWEGCIEFGRPRNYVDDGNSPEFHLVRPREGLMILFPSYFYHQTVPFETDGARFTVSFDLIPLS